MRMMELLLHCKADAAAKTAQASVLVVLPVLICDPQGHTALHDAARIGSVDAVKLLLSFGAEADARREVCKCVMSWSFNL